MPRPQLTDIARFKTSQEIADILDIERDTLIRRIEAGIYPPPTMVKDNGLRLFSDKWLRKIIPRSEIEKEAK